MTASDSYGRTLIKSMRELEIFNRVLDALSR